MRVLLFSDSHGRSASMHMICQKQPPDAIVHLGDCVRDVQRLDDYAPVYALRGNNDFASHAPDTLLIELGGLRIFGCHGHLHRVSRDLLTLGLAAREAGADLALFGHTHIPHVSYQHHITFCNPGSISASRQGANSYAELLLADGKADIRILRL